VHASQEALTLHSPVAHPGSPWLTLLARWECLKWHGVGERESELGADFSSVVLRIECESAWLEREVAGQPNEDWKGAGIEQAIFAILDDSAGKLVWQTFIEEFRSQSCRNC